MEKIFYKRKLNPIYFFDYFSMIFSDDLQLKRRAPYISLEKSLGCLGDKRESALWKVRLISLKVNRNLSPTNGLISQKVNSVGNNYPPKSKVTRKAPKDDLSSYVMRKAPKGNLHYCYYYSLGYQCFQDKH